MPTPSTSPVGTPLRRQPNGTGQVREQSKAVLREMVLKVAPRKPRAIPHVADHICYVRLIYGFSASRSHVGRWQKRCRNCSFMAWATGAIEPSILEAAGIFAQLDLCDSLKPIPRVPQTPALSSHSTASDISAQSTPSGLPDASQVAPPPYVAHVAEEHLPTPPPPSGLLPSSPRQGRQVDCAKITVLIWLLENSSPLKFQCAGGKGGHFALTDDQIIQKCFAEQDDIKFEAYEASTNQWDDGHTLATVRPLEDDNILLYRKEGIDPFNCNGLFAQVKIIRRMHEAAVKLGALGYRGKYGLPRVKGIKRLLVSSDSEDGDVAKSAPALKRSKMSNVSLANGAHDVIIISD